MSFLEKPQSAKPPAPSGAPSTPCDKTKVLIVDDEMRIREVFKLVLSDGLPETTIDAAPNGRDAIEMFSTGHHGVIVLDLHMSVMDGQAAFVELQKKCAENSWEMPSVVFCTGFAHPETVRSIVVRNATHCLLSKPVRGETLLNVVKTRLGLLKT